MCELEIICVYAEKGGGKAYTDSPLTLPTPSCHRNGWTQEERILGNGAGQGVSTPHRICKVLWIKCVFVRDRRNQHGPGPEVESNELHLLALL